MPTLRIGNDLVTPIIKETIKVPKVKYGADIDAIIGDVDENGVLQVPSVGGALNFAGVKVINKECLLTYKFRSNTNITSVDLSSLIRIDGNNTAANMFQYCYGITSIDLSSLTSIRGSNTATHMFSFSSGIKSVDLSSLTSISGSSAASNMFYSSAIKSVDISSLTSINGSSAASNMFRFGSSLTSVDMSSLTSINGSRAVDMMFDSCSKLPAMYFPMLQTSDTNSWTTNTFNITPLLTEIHFRKDMADIVPTFTGYSTKWGATNATIYFDLVGKITVGGTTYDRSEQDSIRSNHVKQYVGWTNKTITVGGTVYTRDSSKDTIKSAGPYTFYPQVYGWINGATTLYTKDRLPTTESGVYTNIEATTSAGTISEVSTNDIVYTEFDSTTEAEPDIGTTVYSDAGQTVLGTIEAIA